jgi:hypothetical protein
MKVKKYSEFNESAHKRVDVREISSIDDDIFKYYHMM